MNETSAIRRTAAARSARGEGRIQVRVTLSDDRASAIQGLSRETGRAPADLVAEAVDSYLSAAHH